MNSRLGSGLGAAMLMGPDRSSRVDEELDGAGEVGFVNPGDVLAAVALRAAQADAHQIEEGCECAAGRRG